ncbi:MAG: bifunctional DNA primase/helicase [Bacteroidetes bacterium]|nr:bifunctional DNA primase/helicase [Bacteroidota bacterium]
MALDKTQILDKTDGGADVFMYFLDSRYPGFKKAFRNPFYEDNNASCYLYRNPDTNVVYFIDFGDGDFHLDCFGFVGLIFNLQTKGEEFLQILEKIDTALALGLASNQDKIMELKRQFPQIKTANELEPPMNKEIQKPKKYLKPKFKDFTSLELEYWQQYGITRDVLIHYNVRSIETFYGENYSIQATPAEPIFGYQGNGYIKIYSPKSTARFKYSGSVGTGHVFGLSQLPKKGDLLFVTSGEKDVLSLASKGFNAICFNSESKPIPKNVIRRLHYRFRHIVLLFDVDETGLKWMNKGVEQLQEYEVKKLLLPLSGEKTEKDISDYFKLGNSAEALRKLFLKLLDEHYDETMSHLSNFEVLYDKPPASAEAIVEINDVPVGTAGNIMAITGPEGSGKSNFLGALIAGTLTQSSEEIDLLGMDVARNSPGKGVLYYDTEQSEEQLYKNLKHILRRSKLDAPPNWFRTYGLVGMGRKDRLVSILHSMDRYYYEYGGIHLVVIDGIADLIEGVNDEERSVMLIEELFRLASIYQTCIVCVLHLSPSGYKLRGHLGSEVQRKAAGIISIEKDEDKLNSLVKALKVRDGSPLDIPQVIIGWDDELKFHVYKGTNDKVPVKKQKSVELREIAEDIYSEHFDLGYTELVEQLKFRTGVKDRQAKNYIKTMVEEGILCQSDFGSKSYHLFRNENLFSTKMPNTNTE